MFEEGAGSQRMNIRNNTTCPFFDSGPARSIRGLSRGHPCRRSIPAWADAQGLCVRSSRTQSARRGDIAITLKNEDESFQGFDSDARRTDKIVTAKGKVTIKFEPLATVRYPFRDEFHDATAQGVLVVE
jgi:hypothetical protein